MRTAGENGIERLYHYELFQEERLRDVLTNHRIWVSSPAAFNDPWDFKFDVDVEGLNDPETRRREVAGYIAATTRVFPDLPLREVFYRADKFRRNPHELVERAKQAAIVITTHAEMQYRVYCTGTRWNCELMWAHYGAKHTGICLEFATNNPVFSGALEVEYLKEFPKYRLFGTDDKNREIERIFTAKSSAWDYEKEYRVVAQERTRANPHPTLLADGNYLAIPITCLTSIMVGCMANVDTMYSIRQMVKESGHSVAIRQLERAKGRYDLVMR